MFSRSLFSRADRCSYKDCHPERSVRSFPLQREGGPATDRAHPLASRREGWGTQIRKGRPLVGLVPDPDDWKWSSFRHQAFREMGVVEIES